jgi:hypothetical protein
MSAIPTSQAQGTLRLGRDHPWLGVPLAALDLRLRLR